jgi:tetratricopeptide (TPR) repeat protein
MSESSEVRDDDVARRVQSAIGNFYETAELNGDEPLRDPIGAAERMGKRIVYEPADGDTCSRHSETTIVVDQGLLDDPEACEDAVRHGLVHSLLRGAGIERDLAAAHMRQPLVRATSEVLANAVDLQIAAPSEFIRKAMAENTDADNFLLAWQANLPLYRMTIRLLDLVANPFTRDVRLGLHFLSAILPRCLTRNMVVGADLIEDYLPFDPREGRNELMQTQAIGILESIRSAVENPGPTAGARIFHVIRGRASSDFAIFIEHLPLRVTQAIIYSLASLPASDAAIALSLFWLKLGHFHKARAVVENMKWIDRFKAAEGLALLGRIEKLTNPDMRVAEATYRKAKEKHAKCEEAVTGLANVLTAQMFYGPALKELGVLGDIPSANYYRGKVYEKQGDYDEAVQFYNRVVYGPWWKYNEIDPRTIWNRYSRKAVSRLAYIHSVRNDHDRALSLYSLLFSEHPYDAASLQDYVPYLLRLGRLDEAVQRILTVANVSPLSPFCFRMLGEAYTLEGRDDFALPMWLGAKLLEETMPKIRRAA